MVAHRDVGAVTVTMDASGLREKLIDRMNVVADDAVESMFLDMARDAPRDTGNMTNSLDVVNTDNGEGGRVGRRVSCPVEYASWQDEGTGVYGPAGTPITPKSAKVLVFYWAKTGKVMYLPSVQGSPATKWWTSKIERWVDYVREALR